MIKPLKPGQKIFYRKSIYAYDSVCVLDRKFIYAKNIKHQIIKKLPISKIRIEDETKTD